MAVTISPYAPLTNARETVLLCLQAVQVVFLAIHDWVPLGRLNDVSAVRRQDTASRMVTITLIQTVPFAIGLLYSVSNFGRPYPGWLMRWLFIAT